MLVTGYLRDYLVKPDNLDIVFPVVLSVWFILSAHWLYNWITHSKYHLKIRLHRLLTFIWFLKISWLVFTYMTVVFRIVPPLYRSDPTRPGPAGFTFWVWGLTHYVFETLVYFSLILISKGMSITRTDLGKKEKNSLTVMMHAIIAFVSSR
ncbi:hypothetical protein BKA69DRAFT_13332 [Paraphysoderma sedebokerense]|nr:hypothetical protein BKA69DRAFT_13332 [Paraphysoderma sedebokerense]